MEKYQMFDKMLEGVQVLDKDMNYLYLNDAVAKQSMSTVDELIGENIITKFPSVKGSLLLSKIEECLTTRKSHKMQNEFTHNNGEIGWFDLRIEPIDDGVIIFSFDVTAQKQLEIRINELNKNFDDQLAKRVQELEENFQNQKDLTDHKIRFVSMAAHQFRTPLTSIILSTSLVEQYGIDLIEKEKIATHFSRIKNSADHMISILNDFLDCRTTENGMVNYNPNTLDFCKLAESVVDSLEPLLKDGQEIRLWVKPIPCNAYIDQELTRGILLNLLSNAIKYSHEHSLIRLNAELTKGELKFEVIDSGIGIPKEEQENLFTQFYRASNAKGIQGTGLGLNIVKQFLDRIGGKISFNSEPGRGTSFRVHIPNQQVWAA